MRPQSRWIVSFCLLAALAWLAPATLPAAPVDETLQSWRAARRSALRARSLVADKNAPSPVRFGLLVIPVDFSDHRLPTDWNPAGLAPRLTATDGQSLRHYFDVASAGRCEVVCLTAPLVRLSGAAIDYSDVGLNGFTRTRRLATEAIGAVAAAGYDLRLADLDGPDGLAGTADDDGWVDGVLILHAAAGQENDPQEGRIQALQYYLETPVVSDGVNAGPYAVASLSSGPGIWAHETAHLLGLEDRYDPLLPPTNGAGDLAGSGGLGVFSLMAAGAWGTGGGWNPALPDAYSRALLGWCDIAAIGTGAAAGDTLKSAPDAARAHRVWTRGETGPEFFLLEARDPAAAAPFDAALPAAGLVILHVDENVPEGGWSDDGFQQWHLRTRLVEADGNGDLRQGNDTGAAADVFPGPGAVSAWTPETDPATDGYGGPSGVSITGIAAVPGGIVHHTAGDDAPWLTFDLAFAPTPPHTLRFTARVEGGAAASLSVLIEALGDDPGGAFAGDATSVEVPLQADATGRWSPIAPPVWIQGDAPAPSACTTFRCTVTGPGLTTLVAARPWCWSATSTTLDFASTWPGEWTVEQPDGPGTSWRRWTGVDSPAADQRPVLVCTGESAEPGDWPAVNYTNGGRARLTSGLLGPDVGGVRLVHWVDVETLPGGVPMDGAVASWIGPDGAEALAEPVRGWSAQVDATSASALRGRGSFGEPAAAFSEGVRPLWRTDLIPVPDGEGGPWRLRLELAANDLWRGRGWMIADCRAVAVTAMVDENLTWDAGLSWNWLWSLDAPSSEPFSVQARTLPDSSWSTLSTTAANAVAAGDIVGRWPESPGTRRELRVTGPSPWGILALAPVTLYVDGGGGSPDSAESSNTLGDPWPNPAAGVLRFTLRIPDGTSARLRIFDLRGRLVHARNVPPGTLFAEWTGNDDDGRRLPSGTYVLKLDGVGAPVTRKVVLRH